ncbi:MAG: hypothetical protein HQ518_10720 [Rhodopirellula sp.]|nr:hypothetical protein [Rhodopirellula sp.]
MHNRKPTPLFQPRERKRCPVCAEIAYSSAGIHPQCAVHQSDSKRMEAVKLKKQAALTRLPAGDMQWQKTCSRCKAILHVRRKVCDCGYSFPLHAR